MKYSFYAILLIITLISSCTTEVDLNAPYKSTTVIFGLLDPDYNGDNVINNLDTQWIKINRTFLGEGNNNVYAGIQDSSEYDDSEFTKKVVQRFYNGVQVDEYPLISKTISNRDMNGIFYGPEQTVYYFVPPVGGLNQNSEYKISLVFTNGNEVNATTNVVNYGTFSWQSPQTQGTLLLANVSFTGEPNYVQQASIRWNAASNAVLYDAKLRFHYTEEVYDNSGWSGAPLSVTEKYVDFYLGSKTAEDVTAGALLKIEFSGEGFFSFLENNIEVNPNIRRIIGNYDQVDERTECFDVLLTIGNNELNSYIEVNTASSAVAQERPVYTNVANGLGLFASRGSRNQRNLSLIAVDMNGVENPGNLYALIQGHSQYLNFCDPNPTSDFNCE